MKSNINQYARISLTTHQSSQEVETPIGKKPWSMFHVENFASADFQFAVDITDKMRWDMTKEDFEFAIKLEPRGCFVLFLDSERIGIVTTISHGKVGWLGNLIVAESHRRSGAGTLLARHAIDYLMGEDVETIGLYAYIDRIPFYRRLGFQYDSEFIVLKGKSNVLQATTNVHVREAGKEDQRKIFNFDQTCFNGSRRKLLTELLRCPDNSCYVSIQNGHILGYVVGRIHDETAELGPLVCMRGRNYVAIELLKASLSRLSGLEISACVQKKESAILNMLRDSGFSEDFRVARMFFKSKVLKDCIYVAESLERG